jgi:hypothetical protein
VLSMPPRLTSRVRIVIMPVMRRPGSGGRPLLLRRPHGVAAGRRWLAAFNFDANTGRLRARVRARCPRGEHPSRHMPTSARCGHRMTRRDAYSDNLRRRVSATLGCPISCGGPPTHSVRLREAARRRRGDYRQPTHEFSPRHEAHLTATNSLAAMASLATWRPGRRSSRLASGDPQL